ncbi:glycosyltransferase family 2 protein [Pontibacter mangrovi]|uniref:Glycosyltransferase family 2 protein n=2 Tax=Pontibacter mangrovi TaxID=2589816 RepID=A0A501WF03_9BACT|nr:glycosyltransferase family 2 protein [Pontibacter mangrovi]
MKEEIKISATVITFNEERNIARCLQSLQGVADEIVVVDSFSTDGTQAICESFGVRFVQHPFGGYIEQKNYAVTQATYDHVLALDADECLSEELIASIKEKKKNFDADGFIVNRLNNYCGQWIHHGGFYPDAKLRLWNRNKGQWGGTNPHDKVMLQGEARKLKGDLLHYAYATVGEHIEQANKFARIAADAAYKKGKKINFVVHVLLNPGFKFFKKYFLKLGFLDGYYGFVFCGVSAQLNFLKYLRLYELYRQDKKK